MEKTVNIVMLSLLLARGHAAEPLESGGSVARARTDHTLWCYSEWELNFINIDGAIWYIWRTLETRCHSALGTSAPCATSGSGWARAPAGHSAAPRSEGSTWGPRFYFWTGGTARQRSGWECRTKELSENFSTRYFFFLATSTRGLPECTGYVPFTLFPINSH